MEKIVPFLDLRILEASERQEILSAINRVFDHGVMVLGVECQNLEEKFAQVCGRKYGVGVCSGTAAVYLSLRALDIGPGDEVITTSLSWVATANAIAMTGATPVFADIKEDLNIDPATIEPLITQKTKAILPVHYTGKICDMDAIKRIAKTHNLHIVEDAAQAFTAKRKGELSGTYGILAAFSMNPMKVFGACGEAGMIVTDDPKLADRLISLRYNGTVNREVCMEESINARLDSLQAAILLARLPRVPSVIKKRRALAELYGRLLKGVVRTPQETPGDEDTFYTYTIQCENRDELKTYLESKGIETKIHHPILMPEQPVYKSKTRGTYPLATQLVSKILSLPVHEKLQESQVEFVASHVIEFYKGKR